MAFFSLDDFNDPERYWFFGFDINLFDNNVPVISVTEFDFVLIFGKDEFLSCEIFVKYFYNDFVIFGINVVVIIRRTVFLHEENRFLKSSWGYFFIVIIVIVVFMVVCFDVLPLLVWWVNNNWKECYSYNNKEDP